MSKLLTRLREQLHESTATTAISYGSGGPVGRNRRNRSRAADPVDALVVSAAARPDQSLQEAAVLFLEARSHVRFTGQTLHPLYTSTISLLEGEGDAVSANMAFNLYSRLHPLLETAASEPTASQDTHKKFVSSLAKEFGVEVLSYIPVNEGVFIHVSQEDSDKLATEANEVRKFAEKSKYLVLRRGNFSSSSDQTWVFVSDPNSGEEIGSCETP